MHILVVHTLNHNSAHATPIETALASVAARLSQLPGVVRIVPCYSNEGQPTALVLTTWASQENWEAMQGTVSTLLRWPSTTPAFSVRHEQVYDYLWGFYRPGPAASYLARVTASPKDEERLRACAQQFTFMPAISSAFLAREQATGHLILVVMLSGNDTAAISYQIQDLIAAHLPQEDNTATCPAQIIARILQSEPAHSLAKDQTPPTIALRGYR